MKTCLIDDIMSHYQKLLGAISKISKEKFFKKSYTMSGIEVSAADIIAYQIGWGELLIYWYRSGIQGIEIIMPGCGFDKWDYQNLALLFYKKYSCFSYDEILGAFDKIVIEIVQIVEQESVSGNLDKLGVWKWCNLKSGKQWPLRKWIRVNTIAPYKRAYKLLS